MNAIKMHSNHTNFQISEVSLDTVYFIKNEDISHLVICKNNLKECV